MSTTFPTAKQEFNNPTSTSKLNNPSHSTLHSNLADTVEAIEDKLGITGSLISGCGGLYPGSDSITALQFCQSDGITPVMTIDTTNKRIGIKSTASLIADLTIEGNSGENLYIQRYSSNSGPPSIKYWKARGTVAIPTKLVADDDTGKFEFWGYARNPGDTDDDWVRSGMIIATVESIDAQNRLKGKIEFYNQTSYTQSNPNLVCSIDSLGFSVEKTFTATVSTQGNSFNSALKCSVWDTDNIQAEDRKMYWVLNAGSGADGAEPYYLSLYDNSDIEMLRVDPMNAVAPAILIPDYILHLGDTNTGFRLQDDRVTHYAGGVTWLDMHETAQDVLYIGNGALGAGGTDIDVYIGTNNALMVEGSSGNIYIAKTGTATAGTQYSSQTLYFTASVWDTSNTQAEDRNISIVNVGGSGADGSEPYYLSILNNTPTEFMRIDPVNRSIQIDRDLTHLGDTDTYLRFGTNNITFVAAGSSNLYVDSTYITMVNIRFMGWRQTLNDDASFSLPSLSYSAKGTIIVTNSGVLSEYTDFIVDGSGNVTLINPSANVVANADTDANICIGTAAAQEPLVIKNRLGGQREIVAYIFHY